MAGILGHNTLTFLRMIGFFLKAKPMDSRSIGGNSQHAIGCEATKRYKKNISPVEMTRASRLNNEKGRRPIEDEMSDEEANSSAAHQWVCNQQAHPERQTQRFAGFYC
jgi:hypothetical protein